MLQAGRCSIRLRGPTSTPRKGKRRPLTSNEASLLFLRRISVTKEGRMTLKSMALAAAMAAGLVAARCATSAFAANAPTDKGITVALAVEPDSRDPSDTQTAQNANVSRSNIYESLTRVSPDDGKVIPLLALSWNHVSDLVWEFKLRPNVKFQDGTPFNAAVAAATIRRTQAGTDLYNGKLACFNAEEFPDVVKAEAVDDLTVRVTTTKVDPIMPLRLSYVDMGDMASQTSP